MQGSRRTLVPAAAALAAGLALAFPAGAMADLLAPESPASSTAEDTRVAYVVMVVIGLLIALGAIAAVLAAVRGGAEAEPERRVRGTTAVQWRVGGALTALVAAVFVFGVIVTESARDADTAEAVVAEPTEEGPAPGEATGDAAEPGEPLRIGVSGQRWLWRYEYPDGTFSYYEMVVPVDTPVVLELDSIDVMHRWWVPALGGMFDAVPGSGNTTSFQADEVGSYEGRSTEFSGPAYAQMRALVRVVEQGEYDAWLEQQAADIQEAQAAVQERIGGGEVPEGEGQ